MLLFQHCTASCGYVAAFVSCLSFGSFCVPMKGKAAKECDVHPLVFQSYKTIMCFLTSFSVLLLGVDKLAFSPWGIVSGLFWVPAGITYVCGVRTAGLAICHGTAASIIVMVSFSWGIFVFHERVRSLTSALFAVFLMICGIFGMSFASAPTPPPSGSSKVFTNKAPVEAFELTPILEEKGSHDDGGESDMETAHQPRLHPPRPAPQSVEHILSPQAPRSCEHLPLSGPLAQIARERQLSCGGDADSSSSDGLGADGKRKRLDVADDPAAKDKGLMVHPPGATSRRGAEAIVSGMAFHAKTKLGVDLSVRQMGLLIAGVGATWGGSVMVPLHYAGESAQGLGFVFSFAIGATLVNLLIWFLCFLSALRRHGCDCGAAFRSLPSFHCSKMAVPGAISGVLWSIGNMASMISVTYLGEGVGYSMTQSAMLVSGMWGIFLFREITNPAAIRGWMASACLTIAGILLLSYNHLPPNAPAVLKKH